MSARNSTSVAPANGLRARLAGRTRPEHLAAAAGVTLVIATWANTAVRTTQPLVYADEAGYIIHARGFAGLGEFYGNSYHPGFGLLISPLFWAAESIHTAFRGVQAVNLALLLVTFWLMVRIVRRVVPSARPVVAPVAATVVLIYPSWAGFAALALPECLLLLMATGTYHLALEGFDGNRRWALPAGAFVAGLIPVVHPRAAVVPLAWGAVTLLGLALRRLAFREAVSIAIGGVAGAALTLFVLSVTSVPSEEGGTRGTGFLTRLLELDNAVRYPSAVFGHWFYAAVATAGLVPLGWFLLGRRTKVSLAALVTVLSASLALLVSAAFMLTGLTDKAIYGRYVEPFVAVFAAVGLATLIADRRRWHLAVMLGSIALPALLIGLMKDGGEFIGRYNRSNVLSLVPLIDELGGIRIGWMAFVAVLVAIGVWFGSSARARAVPALLLLAGAFLATSSLNATQYFESSARTRSGSSELAALAMSTNTDTLGGHLECITLDRRSIGQWYRFNYQTLMHRTRVVEVIRPSSAALECSPWILSTQLDISERVAGSRLVGLEANAGVGLWVAPGPVQDALARSDRLFPEGWTGPIPESARSGDIELVAADTDGGEVLVELTIRHTGSGSPWPGATGLPASAGNPVRVAVALVESSHVGPVRPSHRANIPPTVAPGENFTIQVRLPWPEETGSLDPTWSVSVELVQDGVAWFPEPGRFELSDRR